MYLQPEDVAARLDNVHPTSIGFKASCPAHEDHNPSLSISQGERATVLYCHSGCSFEEICEAIEIQPQQLFHNFNPNGASVGTDIDNELNAIIRAARSVPEWFTTVGDITYEALSVNGDDIWWECMAWSRLEWPEFHACPYREARRYRNSMTVFVDTFLDPFVERNPSWEPRRHQLLSTALLRVQRHWKENYG